MGAKITDYKSLIRTLREESLAAGNSYLEISAKELMEQLNEGNATLITCCSAMRQCMLENDEILVEPTGKKNVSTKMKVRYYTDDLENRKSVYVPKKRGRKPGMAVSKSSGMRRNPKTGKLEVKFNREYMVEMLTQWLERKKMTYIQQEDYFTVKLPEGNWLIDIDYEKRGKKQTFNSKMYSLIKMMEPQTAKYSILMESKISSKQEWKQLNDYVKKQLNISLLFINQQGKIKEYL